MLPIALTTVRVVANAIHLNKIHIRNAIKREF